MVDFHVNIETFFIVNVAAILWKLMHHTEKLPSMEMPQERKCSPDYIYIYTINIIYILCCYILIFRCVLNCWEDYLSFFFFFAILNRMDMVNLWFMKLNSVMFINFGLFFTTQQKQLYRSIHIIWVFCCCCCCYFFSHFLATNGERLD